MVTVPFSSFRTVGHVIQINKFVQIRWFWTFSFLSVGGSFLPWPSPTVHWHERHGEPEYQWKLRKRTCWELSLLHACYCLFFLLIFQRAYTLLVLPKEFPSYPSVWWAGPFLAVLISFLLCLMSWAGDGEPLCSQKYVLKELLPLFLCPSGPFPIGSHPLIP